MANNTKIWFAIAGLVLITVATSVGIPIFSQESANSNASRSFPTPVPEDKRDLSKYGIVDFDNNRAFAGEEGEERRTISQRYEKQGWVSPNMTNPEIGGIYAHEELPPVPLFPYEESDLVIVGEVEKADAYLTNDKRSVYTELTIRPVEILKSPAGLKIREFKTDRAGGVVRYPSGQRVRYESSAHPLLRVGFQYILFLRKDDKTSNYLIETSYEIDHGKIRQMEPGVSFEEYKNLDKTAFIETIRRKFATP